MLLPSISKNGGWCTPVTALVIPVLVLCSLSCFSFISQILSMAQMIKFFSGFVNANGLAVFKPGLTVDVRKDERYKIGYADFVHAMMSMMVFMAIVLSDQRVTDSLFPGHVNEMEEAIESYGWCNLQWPVLGVPFKSTWHWKRG